jgi:glyceraldehyde 3-phosphate dehydrogenase
MSLKVGINGFGRIGRLLLKAAVTRQVRDFEVVAVNDVTDARTLAHLLKYDSVHGRMDGVRAEGDGIVVSGRTVRVLSEKDPSALPWRSLGVDVVVESTGKFTNRDECAKHLTAGAGWVILSAPAKGAVDATLCFGVNEKSFQKDKHRVISIASCTTNCLAPVAKVLNDRFKLVRGLMTTVHGYTNDQKILDLPHSDLRRARAAALSIIPTSTGAARAIGLVIPELKGKLDGIALRVPVADGSIVDLTAEVENEASVETTNAAFQEAAAGPMKGILQYCEEELVSVDIIGNPHSSIVDSKLTSVSGGRLIKVFSWYDNEWGFSNRLVDMISLIAR